MDSILTIVLVCFWGVLCIWLAVAIVQGIAFVIYQKTDKIYLSISTRCKIEPLSMVLEYKGKKIDTAFAYTHHNGYYYVLGLNGVYKIGRTRMIKIQESDMSTSEKAIVDQMKVDCSTKISKNKGLLQLYLSRYGN